MNCKVTVAAIIAGCFAVALGARRADAAPPDACKLLSTAQIGAVLGIKVGQGKPVSASNNKVCQWDAPVLDGKTRKGVALALESPSQASSNAATPDHDVVKTPARQIAKVSVDGFRGNAYYMEMPEVGGVKVPKDSSVLQIRVYGFPVDQIKTKEKTFADCVFETLTNGRSQGGCPV